MGAEEAVLADEMAGTGEEADHYVTRLANVNESSEVVSTEDIVNARGVVLVRKGSRIDAGAARQILRHKLLKPLEEQVQIADGLNGEGLHGHLLQLLDKYPDLGGIHAALGFDKDCRRLCAGTTYPPVLIQKLTVLQRELPDEYAKGLFSAWLAALMAREYGLDADGMETAFVAGLMHDMGLLHIAPDIVGKTGALSAPEWRAIQSHVVVGKLVLENIPGLSPELARAVFEHHERCDGTGYPAGKGESELGVLGQIVGLADSMQAIRAHQFAGCGRNLYDMLPYLHMNDRTHFYGVYQAVVSILKRSGLQATQVNPYGELPAMADALLQRGRVLQRVVGHLQELLDHLAGVTMRSRGRAMLRSAQHVHTMIYSSGLVGDELLQWLESLQREPDPATLPELSEIDLMLNELRWQIRNALRAFEAYYEHECDLDAGSCGEVRRIADHLTECLAQH